MVEGERLEIMALVELYRGRRIWKAHGKKRPRPSWEDVAPRTLDGRNAYAIAAKNEVKFAQAYRAAIAAMLDEKKKRDFVKAWESGSIMQVMNTLDFLADKPSGKLDVWSDFVERIRGAYYTIARETSDSISNSLDKKFGKKVIFSYITKQNPEDRFFVRTVEVNPRALKWIDERALRLVKEGMSNQQRAVVGQIIEEGFAQGLHSSQAFDKIKSNIGLTSREYRAIENRREKLEDLGYQPDDIAEEISAYSEELHEGRAKRIARTETIFAESKGRQATWKAAQEAGALGNVQRVWVSPPPGPSPNAPCAICLSLDGQTAELDGAYESSELDEPVEGPPAHPHCRCTETIVAVEGEGEGESETQEEI